MLARRRASLPFECSFQCPGCDCNCRLLLSLLLYLLIEFPNVLQRKELRTHPEGSKSHRSSNHFECEREGGVCKRSERRMEEMDQEKEETRVKEGGDNRNQAAKVFRASLKPRSHTHDSSEALFLLSAECRCSLKELAPNLFPSGCRSHDLSFCQPVQMCTCESHRANQLLTAKLQHHQRRNHSSLLISALHDCVHGHECTSDSFH